MATDNPLRLIPSVDRLLNSAELAQTISQYGQSATTRETRKILDALRDAVRDTPALPIPELHELATRISANLQVKGSASLVSVMNLTGTVLHTNLGRAALPESAIRAVSNVARGNSNLEFDLQTGGRGDRDSHIEAVLAELTGAEAATVVNNNAAAVLISLNALAEGRGVCISRGELVEIGGSFRIPEVMEKSGCTLVEVGATNRTHLKDYRAAIDANTALLMKVHTSNYEIRGFTREVSYGELASLAHEAGLPLLADLGSGTLVNLEEYGLAHEPTVQEVIHAGADLVTFSGDKLLGGPQAGIIAGRKDLVQRIKENPLKRALRVDKMTVAALHEVLNLYRHPETLQQALPTLRHLTLPAATIRATATSLLPAFEQALGELAHLAVIDSFSQIGSGALPLDQLPSAAIEITPRAHSDSRLRAIAEAFRQLPVPVVGRLQDGSFLLDLRTLEDPELLIAQLEHISIR